jgi:hypothetical protein
MSMSSATIVTGIRSTGKTFSSRVKEDDWFTDSGMSAERLLGLMAVTGVDKAVLVQLSSAYGDDNSYVADCASQFPDSFTSVCMVDFRKDTAADEVDSWIGEAFFRGWPEPASRPRSSSFRPMVPFLVEQPGATHRELRGSSTRPGPRACRGVDRPRQACCS